MKYPAHRFGCNLWCVPVCALLVGSILIVFLGTTHSSPIATAGSEAQTDPNGFAREVLDNEVQAEKNDTPYWRFLQTDHKDGRKTENDVVDTKYGEVMRLIAINGQPISPERKQKEDQRIANLLSHTDQVKADEKKRRADADREAKLLKLLPDAFLYRYDGMDGRLTKLKFVPNPKFHPPSQEAIVFHHMAGTMWLDGRQKRLEGIDGRLTSDVTFWGGLLGRLYKGGTFSVRQTDLGSGTWEISKLLVQIDGKALFFKTIGAHQNQTFTNYKRIPTDTTLQQAVNLLKNPSNPSSEDAKSTSNALRGAASGKSR